MVFGADLVVGDTRSSRPVRIGLSPLVCHPPRGPLSIFYLVVPHRPGEQCDPSQLCCTQLSLMPHPSSRCLAVKARGALQQPCCTFIASSFSPSRCLAVKARGALQQPFCTFVTSSFSSSRCLAVKARGALQQPFCTFITSSFNPSWCLAVKAGGALHQPFCTFIASSFRPCLTSFVVHSTPPSHPRCSVLTDFPVPLTSYIRSPS